MLILRIVKGFAIHLWAILIPNSRWDEIDPLDECIEVPRLPASGWDGGMVGNPFKPHPNMAPVRIGKIEYTNNLLNPAEGIKPRLN